MIKLPIFVVSLLTCLLLAPQFGKVLADDGRLHFEEDIRPILKAHCFHCHGEAGVKEAGLDLRLRRFIVDGGDSGPGIRPHSAAESLLVERIGAGEMPPDDKTLSATEIDRIRRWIDQGAKTSGPEPASISDEHITEAEKQFWSFQPIKRSTVPTVKADVRTPIDSFIARRHQIHGLGFSPTSGKTVLIRRLYFDLLGLPPTPAEVDRFLNDSSADAYEKLVDRLLSSPRYGERWGRHWLDVAGYADSEGFTDRDPERPFAFFYRDYVIESFNQGKPFDEFIIEQLAGDELLASPLTQLTAADRSRLIATGFLRMAPDGSASGGVDRKISANETIADTINIVSTSILGLSVGCARCHNHRYDPIRQTDYYRLRALFEPAMDWKQWKSPRQRQVSLYSAAERKQRGEIEAKAKQVEALRAKKQSEHIDRTLYEELLVAPDDQRDALRTAYRTPKTKRSKQQIALLAEYPNIQNISPGSLYLYAEQRNRRANKILGEAQKRLADRLAAIQAEHLSKVPAAELPQVQLALKIPMGQRNSAQLELAQKYPGVFVTAKTLEQVDPAASALQKQYQSAAERCKKLNAKQELADLAAKAAEIRATAPREYFVRALVEPENHAPRTYLFKRGSHNQPGQEVAPGELEVLNLQAKTEIPQNDPQLKTTGRRLAYAKHLTNGQHPLVARVIVNRLWLHHFGKGLVATAGDFGFLGAKPTHPELLDWLACELMESGWNLKHVQRLILQSRTYRQSATRSELTDRVDPPNDFYARQSVRRLESESIRDSVLAVSGMFVNKMFGPPIPVKEDGVGQIVLGKQKLDGERKPQPGNKLGAEAERRSVYIQVRRSRPLAVLESFDVATVSPNCTQRHRSNVAPQSLMLMNSRFMIRYSQKLADRVQRECGELNLQVRRAFELCFSRSPADDQLRRFLEFVEHQKVEFLTTDAKLTETQARDKALANFCHALLSSNEFIYID